MSLTITQQIKMALVRSGVNKSELARRLGCTPQNINIRINRGRFTKEEMDSIAHAIGAEWIAVFRFPDGSEI